MTDASFLIDSNLLVYAYEDDVVRSEPARQLIASLSRKNQASVSVQNLAEFSNVAAGKKKNVIPLAEAQTALAFFSENLNVLPYGLKTVSSALALVQSHGTPFYDALLAATMIENGIATIYTENVKDFERIPGIKAVNPFE